MITYDPTILQKIIAKMGARDANKLILVDSLYQYFVTDTMLNMNMRLFSKLHIIHAVHGRICTAIVTPGTTHDSPIFREMILSLPYGSGNLLGDAAYCSKKNCQAVHDTGRSSIFDPKSNQKPNGFNPHAEMLRCIVAHPHTFYKTLAIRNNVESVFSSMKRRFGSVVRAKKEHAQKVELLSML